MNSSPDELLARRKAAVQAKRARGPASFVWRNGVLLFGGIWTLFMASAVYWLFPGFYPPFVPQTVPRFVVWLLLFLPAGLLAGYLYGRSMWSKLEANNWYLPPEDSNDTARPAI